MSPKMLTVVHERCSGCRMCEARCSLRQKGDGVGPAYAAIRVHSKAEYGIDLPIVCQQCSDAPCAMSCPTNAISRNSRTGALVIKEAACIGCKACYIVCPLGAISVDPATGKVFKCDLCDGDPQCTRFCVTQALRYEAPDSVSGRKTTVRTIIETLVRNKDMTA